MIHALLVFTHVLGVILFFGTYIAAFALKASVEHARERSALASAFDVRAAREVVDVLGRFVVRTYARRLVFDDSQTGVRFMIFAGRCVFLVLFGLHAAGAQAQDSALAPFEAFIGGEWHLGDSVQRFEWGPGGTSVIASSYAVRDGQRREVSHGIWYWHPEKQAVVGRVTATGMPIELFEYETRFEGEAAVHDLVAYGPEGEPGVYVETWELTDPNTYLWRLLLPRPDTTEVLMSGTFRRDAVEE